MDQQLNKRQQQYQKTLQAIRTAVDTLVQRLDFDQMGVRDICKEAEISLGTFYHYFPSKNALLMDRYLRANRYFNTLYEERLRKLHPIDALQELADQVITYNGSRVLQVLTSYCKAMLDEYTAWTEVEERAITALAGRLLRQGLEEGAIRAVMTAEEALALFTSLINGVAYTQCITRGAFLADSAPLRRGVRIWLEGLRGEA